MQADAGLMLPNFSSSERTFQLIAQAAGRVGRGRDKTRVIVQTFQPNAPAVIYGAAQNYAGFYEHEIKNRYRGHFPPFAHLLKLTCTYKTEKGAVNSAKKLAEELRKASSKLENSSSKIQLLGPAPAFYERQRDSYRWQIIVRASSRAALAKLAEIVPPAKWQAELDPNSLI
jgi:primosomal protein N' (replication factor Y)